MKIIKKHNDDTDKNHKDNNSKDNNTKDNVNEDSDNTHNKNRPRRNLKKVKTTQGFCWRFQKLLFLLPSWLHFIGKYVHHRRRGVFSLNADKNAQAFSSIHYRQNLMVVFTWTLLRHQRLVKWMVLGFLWLRDHVFPWLGFLSKKFL